MSIRIDAAAGERKTGLDRAQSEKQTGEAQAAATLGNRDGSIQMARLRRPEPNDCTICLTEIDPSKPYLIKVWPGCEHEYHKECIQGWRRTCPNCRRIRFDKMEELNNYFCDSILDNPCLFFVLLTFLAIILIPVVTWSL